MQISERLLAVYMKKEYTMLSLIHISDKELQTQLAKEFANITSKGLTPVPVYDVDGKVIAFTRCV